ncbi:MAG TPA: polynucleotide adenylyltransferase PcnB [Porticoccaceae bacterium]|nr:polynucleotide adenylyltransferase PcnB [Porticoccaceae bacterium]
MLKRLIKIFAPRKSRPPTVGPHILKAGQHAIKPRDISSGASKIVDMLEEHKFQAYVVGGCVRDILLGRHPKDFDVATNATPEEVKALFRRARIVGRRFQIVHVHMGRDLVEVTTFRANHGGGSGRGAVQSDQGMLLRDNVFGDINEDAQRRDFTVNALYYHPRDNTLYDYAGGLADIEARRLRIIGDPETRFREDPVRMLRAARFAGKLGFTIDPATAAPIRQLAPLLRDIPAARLFDEWLKLFLSGHALATFRVLREFGLFRELFPLVDPMLDEGDGLYLRFVEQALMNTDERIRDDKRVTPAFLLAALLWPPVVKATGHFLAKGENPAMAMQKAGGQVVAHQVDRIAIPRRFSQPMREIWDLQQRLPLRHGRRADHLLEVPRFRAGYDFVLLREQAGEDLGGLGRWWTRYQEADDAERQAMVKAVESQGSGGQPQRRRRRPRRKPDGGAPA